MRTMLRGADGVVANTPESRKLFLEFEPSLRPERVTVITNGWEADDFPQPARAVLPGSQPNGAMPNSSSPGASSRSRCIPVAHCARGSAASSATFPNRSLPAAARRGISSGRSNSFAPAVRRLAASPDSSSSGRKDEWTARCVEESGVADAVEFTGYLKHGESVRAIREADALFLPLHGSSPRAIARGSFPARPTSTSPPDGRSSGPSRRATLRDHRSDRPRLRRRSLRRRGDGEGAPRTARRLEAQERSTSRPRGRTSPAIARCPCPRTGGVPRDHRSTLIRHSPRPVT